jgi:hypothetical protein
VSVRCHAAAGCIGGDGWVCDLSAEWETTVSGYPCKSMAIMEMTGRERGLVAVGLSAECETYLGRRILVEPQYGYGWTSHQGMEGASCPVPVPLDFHLVIGRFFMSHGKLMGGIGTIEELGHAYTDQSLDFRRATPRSATSCEIP